MKQLIQWKYRQGQNVNSKWLTGKIHYVESNSAITVCGVTLPENEPNLLEYLDEPETSGSFCQHCVKKVRKLQEC